MDFFKKIEIIKFFSNTIIKKELNIQIILLENNKTSVIAASEKLLNLN